MIFGGGVNFKVTDQHGRTHTLFLNSTQAELFNARMNRQFFKRTKEENVLTLIDDAPNYKALEEVAEKYGFADYCDFSDINLYGIKRLLKVVVSTLYRYPRLRSRFCFLGSHNGYKRAIDSLMEGSAETLKRFNLSHIATPEIVRVLGSLADEMIEGLVTSPESYVATAITAFGFFDAMLFDSNDYEGYAYIKMAQDLRYSEEVGFHPKGCAETASVVYHEIGHMLDALCGLADSAEFTSFCRRYDERTIRSEVSEYATTNSKELIAEAFAEYMCNPTPRPIARAIGDMINRHYAALR